MSTGLLLACCCNDCRCGKIIQLWKRIAAGAPVLGTTVEYPSAPCSIVLTPAWQCFESVAYSAWFPVDNPATCTRVWWRFKYTRSYQLADLSTPIRCYRVAPVDDTPTTDGSGSVGYIGKIPDGIVSELRRIDIESEPGDITCNVSPSPNWVPTAEDCAAWNVDPSVPADWRSRLGQGPGYSSFTINPDDYPKIESKDIWVWAEVSIIGDTDTYTRQTTIRISTTPTYLSDIDWPFTVSEIAFQATEDFTAFDPAAFNFTGLLSPDSFAPSWTYNALGTWGTGTGAPFDDPRVLVAPDSTIEIHVTWTHRDADGVLLSLEDAAGTLVMSPSEDQCKGATIAFALLASNGSAVHYTTTIYNADGSVNSVSESDGAGQATWEPDHPTYWMTNLPGAESNTYTRFSTLFTGDVAGSHTSGSIPLGDDSTIAWTVDLTPTPTPQLLTWCQDAVNFLTSDSGASFAGNDNPDTASLGLIGAPYVSLVTMTTANNPYRAESDEPSYGTRTNPAILRSPFPTGPQNWFILQGCEDGEHSYWASTTESTDSPVLSYTNPSFTGKMLTVTPV